jgi:hypothetical protein
MNIYGLDITIFIFKSNLKFFYSELNMIIGEPNPTQLIFKYSLVFFINMNIKINLYIS